MLRTENPSLTDAELMVQVSDRVKQAEERRKNREPARVLHGPHYMLANGMLNPVAGYRLGAAPHLAPQNVQPQAQYVQPRPPPDDRFGRPNIHPYQLRVEATPPPPTHLSNPPPQPGPLNQVAQPLDNLAPAAPPAHQQVQRLPFALACPRCHQNHPPDQFC